jgi:glycosyltransferase involved in cell wall biosynthesis
MARGLILTSNFPTDRTVSNFISRLFYNRLFQENAELFILAPHEYKAQFVENVYNMRVFRFPYFYPFKFQKLAYGGGMPYNFKNSSFAKLQAPIFFLSELLFAMLLVKKKEVDFINSQWLLPQGLIGAICSKTLGVPHIACMHSSEITFLSKLPLKSRVIKYILQNSDYIISASEHRAQEMLSYTSSEFAENAKHKIHIIPLGVDICEFNSAKDKEILKEKYGIKSRLTVLFVGRLVEVKGCEYLIQGIKAVIDSFKDVQLIIVGSGPLENSLKNQVRILGLEEYIRFEGNVDNKYINDYYTIADIVVIPSIVDSFGFQEGFPVVVMEALVSGKAIISTKTKGIMEAIQDNYNGILVDQKNANQISDALLELLRNDDLRKKISANAFESGKKYDWTSIAEKYLKLINEVV